MFLARNSVFLPMPMAAADWENGGREVGFAGKLREGFLKVTASWLQENKKHWRKVLQALYQPSFF